MTTNRGGKREGAGRKQGEKTTVIRIPVSFVEIVKALISNYAVNGDSKRKPRIKVTDELRTTVWNEYQNGTKQSALAIKFNLSPITVANIIRERKKSL